MRSDSRFIRSVLPIAQTQRSAKYASRSAAARGEHHRLCENELLSQFCFRFSSIRGSLLLLLWVTYGVIVTVTVTAPTIGYIDFCHRGPATVHTVFQRLRRYLFVLTHDCGRRLDALRSVALHEALPLADAEKYAKIGSKAPFRPTG